MEIPPAFPALDRMMLPEAAQAEVGVGVFNDVVPQAGGSYDGPNKSRRTGAMTSPRRGRHDKNFEIAREILEDIKNRVPTMFQASEKARDPREAANRAFLAKAKVLAKFSESANLLGGRESQGLGRHEGCPVSGRVLPQTTFPAGPRPGGDRGPGV